VKIFVIVHPNSKHPRIIKEASGVLHAYVAVSPVDGKANEAVIKMLALHFSIAKSQIVLLRGHASKSKQFDVGDG
jgi:uncharacterized protein